MVSTKTLYRSFLLMFLGGIIAAAMTFAPNAKAEPGGEDELGPKGWQAVKLYGSSICLSFKQTPTATNVIRIREILIDSAGFSNSDAAGIIVEAIDAYCPEELSRVSRVMDEYNGETPTETSNPVGGKMMV